MSKKILLLCDYSFPSESASAVRVHTISKMFIELGFTPILIGIDQSTNKEKEGSINGINFKNITPTKTFRNIFLRKKNLHDNIIKSVNNYIEYYDPKHLLITHLDGKLLIDILKLCERRNVVSIGNIVEWYDKGDFSNFIDKFKFIRNRVTLIFINRKIKKILTISTFLEKYYIKKGCNVARIPSIIDQNDYKKTFNKKNGGKIIFAYAGSPGTKDSISNFLQGASELTNVELERIKIRLYGISDSELQSLGVPVHVIKKLESILYCFGKIPHHEVKKRISEADFSILVRPDRRSSHAGFPTKLPESLACGTPIIANLTSDMGYYLVDRENALVCANNSKEECKIVIKRAILMSSQELNYMKLKAKHTSQGFDYRCYLEKLSLLLGDSEIKKTVQKNVI